MSNKLKQCINDTKKIIKKIEKLNIQDLDTVKLCKIEFEKTEDKKFERKAETRNIGRLRGFRAAAVILEKIEWKEFLTLESEENLEYPIVDIEQNKEEIKKWLLKYTNKKIKLCTSNQMIEKFIDRTEYNNSKKTFEEVNNLIQEIKKNALEIDEDEYDENPELSEEFMELTEKFYDLWKTKNNENKS